MSSSYSQQEPAMTGIQIEVLTAVSTVLYTTELSQ